MLKHVQATHRCRSSLSSPESEPTSAQKAADTLSLSSLMSYGSLAALSSLSSSCTSLNETQSSAESSTAQPHQPPATTLRLYTRSLRPDLEYRTMRVRHSTSCKELVHQLLVKYRLRHRDPNLFYITMEVATRSSVSAMRTILVLDDDSCPAQLQACYPRVDSRFTIRTKQGGLVKVFDNVLMPGSLYKSLLISQRTTVQQLIQLLLNCYNSSEKHTNFSLYEVSAALYYERKLHEDDYPLAVQHEWSSPSECSFVLRKRLLLTPRTGRQFAPLRRSFVRWSRSRDSSRAPAFRESLSVDRRHSRREHLQDGPEETAEDGREDMSSGGRRDERRQREPRRPRSLRSAPLSLLSEKDSSDDDVFYI